MEAFDRFFRRMTTCEAPLPWQRELALAAGCQDRLVRIPTGFGKTYGVLAAWAWNRLERNDDSWPRRLVWCLPMRVLVEQVADEARRCLAHLEATWLEGGDHAGKVGLHVLMGGATGGDWHLYPEQCAVLVGTQDMLLSRALNRGYGAPRARWPMDFGLLNQDCLWVMDEVQLMDVGLATSAQLQAFRRQDEARAARACRTWWMSATLQRGWLETSPETRGMGGELPETKIPEPQRVGPLWDGVRKPLEVVPVSTDKELGRLVAERHQQRPTDPRGPTLVVLNTVERAAGLAAMLRGDRALAATDVRLVHSRFRPAERRAWLEEFLSRRACESCPDRIIVATQVVEAGVDLSAPLLVTELAPWPSLVQRFGRAARWGGQAHVLVVDPGATDDRAALPYQLAALDSARRAVEALVGGSGSAAPLCLERFEESNPALVPELYPYEPSQLLLRHELDELFDTTPDLSGADCDVSRFIRDGEERDLHVFWAELASDQQPSSDVQPSRDALCAVPFLRARDWLCGKESGGARAPRLKAKMRAWVWDWLDAAWRVAQRRDLFPGQTVLVAASSGGYSAASGWAPDLAASVPVVAAALVTLGDRADAGQDDESLSSYPWQTIAFHGRQVAREASTIAAAVAPSHAALLGMAGRWHDVGKSHAAFGGSIVGTGRPARPDLAKAPATAWLHGGQLYPMPDGSRRPGFRHELASTLALFAALRRHAPDHAALLGPWRGLLAQAGFAPGDWEPSADPPSLVEQELLELDADRFDLLAYLVCAHHGKVRLSWHACPADQESADSALRIRGVREGDELPPVAMYASDWTLGQLAGSLLDLAPAYAGLSSRTGRSWTERVLGLVQRHGPFALAWLEALFRAADQRASARADVADELLEGSAP